MSFSPGGCCLLQRVSFQTRWRWLQRAIPVSWGKSMIFSSSRNKYYFMIATSSASKLEHAKMPLLPCKHAIIFLSSGMAHSGFEVNKLTVLLSLSTTYFRSNPTSAIVTSMAFLVAYWKEEMISPTFLRCSNNFFKRNQVDPKAHTNGWSPLVAQEVKSSLSVLRLCFWMKWTSSSVIAFMVSHTGKSISLKLQYSFGLLKLMCALKHMDNQSVPGLAERTPTTLALALLMDTTSWSMCGITKRAWTIHKQA